MFKTKKVIREIYRGIIWGSHIAFGGQDFSKEYFAQRRAQSSDIFFENDSRMSLKILWKNVLKKPLKY